MRILFSTLLLAAFATSPYAQDPTGQSGEGGYELRSSTDWDTLLLVYKNAHGGVERFDGVNYLSFDYTPFAINEKGEEVPQPTRHIVTRFRDNADEQLQRSMRIETEMPVGTGEDARMVKLTSLVTETSTEVFTEAEDGTYIKRESKEIMRAAVLDAKVLWGQLDLLLYLDSRDLRCTYTGVMTRDKEKFVTAEAAFRPGRELAEPRRLYFDTTTALIERIDVFDAKSNMRLGTTLVSDYKDHEGIKFPELIQFTDRAGEVLGGWRFNAVEVNPEVANDTFLKP